MVKYQRGQVLAVAAHRATPASFLDKLPLALKPAPLLGM